MRTTTIINVHMSMHSFILVVIDYLVHYLVFIMVLRKFLKRYAERGTIDHFSIRHKEFN